MEIWIFLQRRIWMNHSNSSYQSTWLEIQLVGQGETLALILLDFFSQDNIEKLCRIEVEQFQSNSILGLRLTFRL